MGLVAEMGGRRKLRWLARDMGGFGKSVEEGFLGVPLLGFREGRPGSCNEGRSSMSSSSTKNNVFRQVFDGFRVT